MHIQKSFGFSFTSVLIFIAGIAVIFTGIVSAVIKLDDGDASSGLVFFAMILAVACGVIEIITGFVSLSKKKHYINQSRCMLLGRVIIIICAVQLFVSAFNGIIVSHLIIIFVSGIIVPAAYLAASAHGRIKRPQKKDVYAYRR